MKNLIVYDDANAVCKAAAERIIVLSKTAIAEKGKFTIVLSGGNTPKLLFNLLSQPDYSIQLDWKNILVFWGDERNLTATDENNNSHMAFVHLLNKVPIPEENIFPIPIHLGAIEASMAYEKTIKKRFGDTIPAFDLILLGLGDNGHTASLFPHSRALTEKEKWVTAIYVPEVKMFRITFTAQLINQAKEILFLVTGKEKSNILYTIFTGAPQPDNYPAQLIHPVHGNLVWYADKAAVSSLKNT